MLVPKMPLLTLNYQYKKLNGSQLDRDIKINDQNQRNSSFRGVKLGITHLKLILNI